ncbi:MAG: scyllo-inositol 2-dehydrogenase (NAD(+)) [candidate division WS2 bacterium]|nr:scyllo-inositol 2-dehydrogenase (NAD(+)) [Candidatus Psychracetigena formicireducens]
MGVKIGFIGTGGIANYHLEHLMKIKEAEIVALCDVVEERAKEAAEKYKGKFYTDHRKMLKREKLNALYICVPPFAHQGQELLAAEKGIPFFVEKPIGLSLDYAKKVEERIAKNNLVTSVGYQDRYQDIIERIKNLLTGKKTGLFLGYWMGGMPTVSWWRKKEESGGQAVEQTTHIFDLARYLFGEVEKVVAYGRTGLMDDINNYNVEDASSATLYFKNGVVGTIFSACFLSYGGRCGMDIYLKDLAIEYKEQTSIKITEPNKSTEINVGNDFGLLEDQVFVEAVMKKDGTKIRSSYSDAIKTLAVTLAVNESIASGKPVEV